MPKYKRGEHDLRKPACFEYCKRAGNYCPLMGSGAEGTSIVRWSNLCGNDNDLYSLNYTKDRAEKVNDGELQSGEGGYVSGGTTETEELSCSQCSCWGDGSGFEYDIPERYLIGSSEHNTSIYDIYDYAIGHSVLKQRGNSWNAWIEKFQPDYRFGRVSDTNAETILFPNINNPWMFTEYVFKGEHNDSEFIIIEPPLYDPDTLELLNDDLELENIKEHDSKYINEDFYEYKDEDAGESTYGVRQFRRITNWDNWRDAQQVSSEGEYSVRNAGVKLYKANVNVQCVKWGEHGNIPPHTLDMTAPADYLDPTKIVSKIKAVTRAVIGAPLYANAYGVLYVNSSYDMYINEVALTPGTNTEGYPIYTYEIPTSADGIRQDTPQMRNGKKSLKPEYAKENGAYIHGGCGLCHGDGGKMKCVKLEELEKDSDEYNAIKENFDNINGCLTFNNKDHCKYYVASIEYPVIATYQRNAQNMAEYYNAMGTHTSSANSGKEAWADNVLNNSTGLPSADMFVAMGVGMQPRTYVRGDTNLPEETTITYITEFTVEQAAKEMPKLNKEFKDFGKGIQILPDTGKFALDTRENHALFGQDDLNCYDDISPLSCHRFFASVMHCATQANCNEYCGLNQRQGFSPDERAGGDGKCRYYHNTSDKKSRGLHGCPYTCVPKRAVEFSETMQLVSPMLTSLGNAVTELSAFGFWDDDEPEAINYRNLWEVGEGGTYYNGLFFTVESLGDDDFGPISNNPFGNISLGLDDDNKGTSSVKVTVYSKDDMSSQYGGIKMKKVSNSSYPYIVCYMKGTGSTIELVRHEQSISGNTTREKKYKVRKTQITDTFFYYEPLDDNGGSITRSASQHVDDDGLWLCKSDNNFVPPSTNCVMIDNEKKFIGGYHPQYKDFGAHGGEFMQELDAGYHREGHSMGDITNDSEYSGIEDPPLKKGYWIDASGQYIMDERPIGIDQNIANDDERETPSGPGTCISFKKSNTEIDMVEGKRISPKVTNAAVFSNDSYNVINFYKKTRKIEDGKIVGRPMFEDPESDDKYYAPVYCYRAELLPTMRKALHCPKCDYYIAWKYKGQTKENTCPWCGTKYVEITGNGGPKEPGEKWKGDESVIKKFFKLYAIGQVQVWGPPGTCVHTDAYFWRHQAQISNAIKRQIYHRLGDPNKGGGGYQLNKMSKESELTLGYTEAIGYYKKLPGDWQDATAIYKPYHKSKIQWDENKDPTKSAGYNGVMPTNYMPYWDDGSLESVIAPYTTESPGGSNNKNVLSLKMNSYEQMRVLRNAIEPIMAYSSEPPSQSDFPTLRASYENREERSQNIIYRNKRARIAPIVLAYTGGGDAYQEYYSGDLSYGNVREYYPPGYTWWFLKQCLGGRYTKWTQGQYHMDGGGGWAPNCLWPTTKQTIAKCALFIHGVLPLDKDIIAAYIIISPGGPEPSKDPIGRSWNGGRVMYHHYHAKRKAHFGYGSQPHLHGNAGYPIGVYFDEDGNEVDTRPPGTIYFASDDIEFQDYSDYRLWGSNNPKESNHVSTIEDKFFDTMTNLSAMMDISFYTNVGTDKENIEIDGNVIGKGYKYVVQIVDEKGNSHDGANPNLKGLAFMNCAIPDDIYDGVTNRKYNYCLVDENNDIIQPYPNDLIWKTTTEEQLNTAIQKGTSHFEFTVSDGTEENSVSYNFTQTSEDLYGKTVPNNSQGITGYFDMSWTNTTGSIYGNEYTVEPGSANVWTYPVIYQEPSGGSNAGYGGSIEIKNVGKTSRCIDCTSVVKKMYNTRISRGFKCVAGNTLEEVKNMPFPQPETGGSLASVDQDILDAQTVIKDDDDVSYLLTDVDSYPEIDSDGSIPSIDPDGEKYPLAPKKAVISRNIIFPKTIEDSRSYYVSTEKDKSGKEKKVDKKLGEKVIRNMDGLKAIIAQILPGTTFEKKSNTSFEITSNEIIEIPDGEKYIYGSLNIPYGTHTLKQSRVVSCSNYTTGFHPDNLFNNSGNVWVSNSYFSKSQNFIVDLARTPLLIRQRDYRYKSSSADYSNCKCPEPMCSAHEKTCAIAAQLSGKYWDSHSARCPEGHSLEGVEGVVSQPGDGIMTYEYAPMFAENPFITKIVIAPKSGCKCSVAVRYSGANDWHTVCSIEDEEVLEQTIEFNDEEPDERVRARYVRVSCSPIKSVSNVSFTVVDYEKYSIDVIGDFTEFDGFSFVGKKETNTGLEIVSMVVNEEKDGAVFYVNKNLNESDENGEEIEVPEQMNFVLDNYICGIDKFEVYGYHYIDTETSLDYKCTMDSEEGNYTLKYLTMTAPEDIWSTFFDAKVGKYTMSAYPTKIYSVEVCKSDENGIILTETDNKDNLVWTTEEVAVESDSEEEISYLKITGGNYYYDPKMNTIILPKKNEEGRKANTFEDEIRGKGFGSFLPTRVVVRYFSGNGKSVVLSAEAHGQGPSYQLEKDSIQFINEESKSNLESCGKTGKMIDVAGQVVNNKEIEWTCYNEIPSTLSIESASKRMVTGKVNAETKSGEFRKPTFRGDEIAADNDDGAFVALFGENQSRCFGQCQTEVTFTGAPNRILSGIINVTAKDYTEKTVQIDKDTSITTKVRTGGIANGCIIVKCPPSDAGEGLCTETMGLPTLLIYAKERKEDDPF